MGSVNVYVFVVSCVMVVCITVEFEVIVEWWWEFVVYELVDKLGQLDTVYVLHQE